MRSSIVWSFRSVAVARLALAQLGLEDERAAHHDLIAFLQPPEDRDHSVHRRSSFHGLWGERVLLALHGYEDRGLAFDGLHRALADREHTGRGASGPDQLHAGEHAGAKETV